jgi:hypothetical protein
MTSDNQGGVPELPERFTLPSSLNDFSMPIFSRRKFIADLINAVYLPGGLCDKAEQLERRCRELEEALQLTAFFLNHSCKRCKMMVDRHLAILTDAAGEN